MSVIGLLVRLFGIGGGQMGSEMEWSAHPLAQDSIMFLLKAFLDPSSNTGPSHTPSSLAPTLALFLFMLRTTTCLMKYIR